MFRFEAITSLADIEQIEQIDWRNHCDVTSTYELISRSAACNPDSNAIEFLALGDGDETAIAISYAELMRRITQAANLFRASGVSNENVVTYILPNLPETHEIIWGAETAGIVNALNPLLQPEIIKKLMLVAETKVFVTTAPTDQMDLLTPMLSIADDIGSLEAIFVVDLDHYFEGVNRTLPTSTPGGIPIRKYIDERDKQQGDELDFDREIKASDIASLFHTGGTTGTPKLAPHTHENEVFTSFITANTLRTDRSTKYFVGLPLFHVNAVIGTGLSVFGSGGTVMLVTPEGYRTPSVIPNFWKITAKYGATHCSGVPTIYGALMQFPSDALDTSTMQTAIVGAAPISSDMFNRFHEFSGIQLLEGYGLTEGTTISSINPINGERRVGSIGLRIPYQQLKCSDLDEAGNIVRDCEADQVGNIMIKGPNVFPGYLGMESKGFTDDGWFNTGDLGRIDEKGYVWLSGRSKDLIIRGGHNIDPGIIENALASHPSVANVAAVAQPDSYAGELPCAYVDLYQGAAVSAEDLRQYARENIAEKGSAPAYVEILDALPVTAVGKIFKPALREMAIERVIREAISVADASADIHVVNREKEGVIVRIKTDDRNNAELVLGEFPVRYEFF